MSSNCAVFTLLGATIFISIQPQPYLFFCVFASINISCNVFSNKNFLGLIGSIAISKNPVFSLKFIHSSSFLITFGP